jgi:hypothetical protein
MMERLFSIANVVALAGWIALALAPNRRGVRRAAGVVVPLLLCGAYTLLIMTQAPQASGGFGSLAEVSMLFRSPGMLLAGWIHYLAFDLLVGAWEVQDAEQVGLSRWLLLPCLALTFLLGPAGLLLYVGLRAAAPKLTRSAAARRPA